MGYELHPDFGDLEADAAGTAAALVAAHAALNTGVHDLGNAALQNTDSILIASTQISDSTAPGRTLLTGATVAAQRLSLELGNAALQNTDSILIASTQISDSTAPGRTLLTDANAVVQRASLGLGTAAVEDTATIPIASTQISDSTAAGRTLLTAADISAQKTALSIAYADVSGLGNSATVSSTVLTIGSSQIHDSTAPGRTLLTGATAAAQRLSLGLSNAAEINTTQIDSYVTNIGAATVFRPIVDVTSNYNAVAQDVLILDASNAAFSVWLPSAPTARTVVDAKNINIGTWTILGNGNNIDGITNYVMNVQQEAASFVYASGSWRIF